MTHQGNSRGRLLQIAARLALALILLGTAGLKVSWLLSSAGDLNTSSSKLAPYCVAAAIELFLAGLLFVHKVRGVASALTATGFAGAGLAAVLTGRVTDGTCRCLGPYEVPRHVALILAGVVVALASVVLLAETSAEHTSVPG